MPGLFRRPPQPTQRVRKNAAIAGAPPPSSSISLPIIGGYPAEVEADSPTSYWRLGESSGTVIDHVGSNNGSTTGTVTRDTTGLIGLDDDGAVSFAASSYISGSLAAPIGNVFTVEMWVKLPASGTTTICPFSTKGTVSNISMEVARSGGAGNNFSIKCFIYDGANYDIVASTADSTVAAGGTYHIVWSRAGTSVANNKIYVNAVDISNTAGVTETVTNTDTTFYIGGFEGTAETWNSNIDEVALYNGTALSQARVTAHYNAATRSQTFGPIVGAGYAGTVLADAPVAYYRVGEPSGSVIDYTGGTSGSTVGTVTRDVTGALSSEQDDGAITIGASGGVDVAHQTKLNLGNGDFSLEAWVNITTHKDSNTIISKETGAYQLSTIANGTVILVKSGTEVSRFGTRVLSTGQWYHLVWTHTTATEDHLYINGVEDTLTGSGSSYTNNSSSLHLGYEGPDGENVAGSIDELAIYNTILSPTRVLAHWNAAKATQPVAVGQINRTATLSAPTIAQSQSVQPGFITQTATTFSPTVTPGAVTYTPALINQAAATFAPTVTSLATVAPGLITQTAAPFNPTITSLATISVAQINRTATASSPTITTGAVSVAPNFIDRTATASAPTISTTAAISVAQIDRTATASAPTISTLNTISVGLIDRTAATFTPTISATANISVALTDQTAVAFNPTVTTGAAALSVGLINQTAATFTPTVTSLATIAPNLISQTASPFSPSISVSVSPNFIDRTAVTFTPTITTANTISVNQTNQTATAFTPTVIQQQFVSLGLIDRTAATFAPTITTANTISVALTDRTAAPFAPTIIAQQFVSPGLIDQTAAPYDPTVSAGGRIVEVDTTDRTAVAFAPTITTGATNISPDLINQTATPFSPIVSSQASVSVGQIDRTAIAFSPTISTSSFIAVGQINQATQAFTPTVAMAGDQLVELPLINQTAQTFTPHVRARGRGQGGPGRWYGYGNIPRHLPPDQWVGFETIAVNAKAFAPSVEVSDDEVLLGLSEEDLLTLV